MQRRSPALPAAVFASLLVTACSSAPSTDGALLRAGPTAETTCAASSKAAPLPRHPIAELAWCIAAKDNLWSPEHLFHDTLAIPKYTTSEGITWGIQAGAGSKNTPIENLPEGVASILYQRVEPKINSHPAPGHINLVVDLVPSTNCLSLESLTAIFGSEYWLMEQPLVAPVPVLPGARLSHERARGIYGVIFKSPRLFMGNPSGRVNFRFEYTKCAKNFTVYRDLDLQSHGKKGSK